MIPSGFFKGVREGEKNRYLFFLFTFLTFSLLQSCAGTKGDPRYVQDLLAKKYVGKEVDLAVLDMGAPAYISYLDSGRKVYTWERHTNKYSRNVFIKSDERCVVTLLTDTEGHLVELVGKVDDSLGAWQFSYCAEQLDL